MRRSGFRNCRNFVLNIALDHLVILLWLFCDFSADVHVMYLLETFLLIAFANSLESDRV